ncbi:MAG: Gfo/Idh/MocA family oxidoreductase [Abitibacteriaceae bacterium]|nr:Gfo/Idh/MocA family oxidoreductase [Abditibacteriaceae bacterium]MBV9867619.1 Gfo/Idh/MocA family oxidoreductase [Abditibacteriaceae bacterium]
MQPSKSNRPSRRAFIKSSAAAIGASFVAPLMLPRSVKGANEKLNLAWVGFGGMGWGDLNACADGNNVVALCDCDPNMWPRAKNQFPDAKFYLDFRQMLTEMGDKIDAVGVGTPDHNHFAIAYMAINRGKHVFVEKPLVHTLWQARTLRQLAAQKGVVTQMGNQGHASEGARLIKEWYQAGLIGNVREVLAWTDRPNTGVGFNGKVETAFPPPQTPPPGMDWNLWLGPVDKPVGYNREFHPTTWRPWWDFGSGGLGDIGCHTIDTPYWALDLNAPTSVDVALKGAVNPIHTPNGSIVTFNFAARGDKPPVQVKWYEGPSVPEAPAGYDLGAPHGEGGLIMVGEHGGIYHAGMRPDSPQLYPQAKWQEYRDNVDKRVPKTLPRTKGIHRDWIDAIKNGKKSCSDFSYSAPLTEVILLGTLAIRTGKTVQWNTENSEILNNPEAVKLIDIEARPGWRTKDLA